VPEKVCGRNTRCELVSLNATKWLFDWLAIQDELLDWRSLQTLVRSMPDLHKTLILAHVEGDYKGDSAVIHELAMATEHAPFRHRQKLAEVGGQKKMVSTNPP